MSYSQLDKLYNDPKIGFSSITKFYNKVNEKYPQVTRKEVENFLKNKVDVQLLKEIRRPKKYNTIVASAPMDSVQIDLLIYDRYEMNNYKYILVMIDVNSRYAGCRALTNRNLNNILDSLKDIIKFDFGDKLPKNINCDNEFNKDLINKWAEDNKIKMWYSDPEEINKNAIVERFNRTLAIKLQRWRLATGKNNWYQVLKDIVKSYNNDYHRTIKATPHEVFNQIKPNQQEITRIHNILKVGDIVRLQRHQKTFAKGDEIKYSKDIYMITSQIKGKFQITNMSDGTINKKLYKEYELKPISGIIEQDNKAVETVNKIEDNLENNKVIRKLKKEGLDMNVKKKDVFTPRKNKKSSWTDIDTANIITSKRKR